MVVSDERTRHTVGTLYLRSQRKRCALPLERVMVVPSSTEIDAETRLREAKTKVRDCGGRGYEEELRAAAAEYEALTGRSASNIRPY